MADEKVRPNLLAYETLLRNGVNLFNRVGTVRCAVRLETILGIIGLERRRFAMRRVHHIEAGAEPVGIEKPAACDRVEKERGTTFNERDEDTQPAAASSFSLLVRWQ